MSEIFERLMERAPTPSAHTKKTYQLSSVKNGCIAAMIFAGIGSLLLFWPEQIYEIFPYIASSFLLFAGSFDIFRGIKTREYASEETKVLANGIVYIILGFAILYHRKNSDHIIGALWGILGVLKSSEELNSALHKAYLKKPFGKKLIRALVELLLGILLLIDAPAALQHHIFLLGVELLLVGWRILKDAKLLKQQKNNCIIEN